VRQIELVTSRRTAGVKTVTGPFDGGWTCHVSGRHDDDDDLLSLL